MPPAAEFETRSFINQTTVFLPQRRSMGVCKCKENGFYSGVLNVRVQKQRKKNKGEDVALCRQQA